MGDSIKKDRIFDRNVCIGLAIAAVFLTFLVCPFSPIYRYNFEPDEICYHTMALGWLRGKIPYRDLFDHKGPLTYVIYALGLLLTGRNSIGILFVFMAINAATFILLYRILRLCFDKDRSLGGTLLLLVLFFIKKNSLFASGTKPDHFILLILLLSEYIYIRGIKNFGKQTDADKQDPDKKKTSPLVFTYVEMFLIGLCCGAVFMIKINVCIYYLLFIGMYLLWLLIRKMWSAFFASAGSFLLGIALVSSPFLLYFAAKGALSDFYSAYVTFNTEYAKQGGIHFLFSRPFIDGDNQLTILILFLILLISAFIYLHAKGKKLQKGIFVLCGAASYVFLAFPEVFAYSFVLLIPLYLWGTGTLSDLVFAFLPRKTLYIGLSLLSVIIVFNFTLYQLFVLPSMPKEKTGLEIAMEEYFAQNPDATTLYFTNLCDSCFYSLTENTPDFKFFYTPREGGQEIYDEQMKYIRARLPDVIAFYRAKSIDDEYLQKLDQYFENNGYLLYYNDNEETKYYAYVRIP